MNIKHVSRRALTLATLVGTLAACSGKKEETAEGDLNDSLRADTTAAAAEPSAQDRFVESLPSPTHLARIFNRSGLKFVEGITSSPANADKYQSATSKALNLGVYTADLAYSTFNNQSQQALNYFKAVRTLGEGLQMSSIFESSNLVPRVEKNLGNKDSLISLMSSLSMDSDFLLKESNRIDVIYLSVAGGFVESLYLATSLITQNNNLEVYNKILDQQNTINKLISVLEDFKSEGDFTSTIDGLKSIENKLAKLKNSEAGIQSKDFDELSKDVKSFRDQITKGV